MIKKNQLPKLEVKEQEAAGRTISVALEQEW
jgi:hypothetical protein